MGGDKSGRDRKERAKKRGKARDEGAAGEGGEPPPPAVVTVPRHDVVARFLRDHEAKHLLQLLPVVAGEAHPQSRDNPGLCFNELAAHAATCCPQPPGTTFAGSYDSAADRWTYPVPKSFVLKLDKRLELTGTDFIEIKDTSTLFKLVIKGGPDCACPVGGVGSPRPSKAAAPCFKCCFRTSLVVQRGTATCSLEEALYASSGPLFETLCALGYAHPEWPPYHALGRHDAPVGVPPNAGRDMVYITPPASGLLAGCSFASSMLCGAPGCKAAVYFCARPGVLDKLDVIFAGEHSHPALPCKLHGLSACKICPAAGLQPVPAPYGRLRGLPAARALRQAQLALRGHDIAAADGPTAMRAALAATAPQTELLCGCRARIGFDVANLETAQAKERQRVADRSGVSKALPAAQGGPTESVGAIFEGLMQLQREHQQTVPKLGRIMTVIGDSGGLNVIISSAMRATLAVQGAAAGEVFDLDATGCTVKQLAGRPPTLELALVMRKPDGSGSTDVFVAMIEDKSAGNIYDVLNLVNSRFIKHTGKGMAGAVFNTDNDKAERKALFQLFWDRMTPAMATAHMRSVLDDLEAVLADNGLLGVNLYDKPLSIALPIHGLNVAEDGTTLPTIMQGMTPVFSCPGHYAHASFLYPKTSPLFRDMKASRKSFLQTLLISVFRFFVRHPSLAGPESWHYVKGFLGFVKEMWSLDANLPVNTELLAQPTPERSIMVIPATAADKSPSRTDAPSHKIVARWDAFKIETRIYAPAAPATADDAAEEAAAGAADADAVAADGGDVFEAVVGVEDAAELATLQAERAEASPEDDADDVAAMLEDDEEADLPDDTPPPSTGPPAAGTVYNPWYVVVTRRGKAIRPLLRYTDRLEAEALWVGNALRTEFPKLLARAQPTGPAEQRHRGRKHVWDTKLRVRTRSLVDSVRTLLLQHKMEEASLLADWVNDKAPVSTRMQSALERIAADDTAEANNAEAIAALTEELKLLKKAAATTAAQLRGSKARARTKAAIEALGGDSSEPLSAWGEGAQQEAVPPESRTRATDEPAEGEDAAADDDSDEEADAAAIPAGALPADATAYHRVEKQFMDEMAKAERTRARLDKQLESASVYSDKMKDLNKVAHERTPAPVGRAVARSCVQCRGRAYMMCARSTCIGGACCAAQGLKLGAKAPPCQFHGKG